MDSLSKQAYQQFIQDLGERKFPEKYHVVDTELAKRYGMSRTPVRSAIQQLENDGVLKRYGKSLILQDLCLNDQELQQFILLRREYYQLLFKYIDLMKFQMQSPLIKVYLQELEGEIASHFPFDRLISVDQLFFNSLKTSLNSQDLIYSLNNYRYCGVAPEHLPLLETEVVHLKEIYRLLKESDIKELTSYIEDLI